MTNISKRLEQVVSSAQQKLIEKYQILPIKVAEGILVGDVLIVSEGTVKHLKYQQMLRAQYQRSINNRDHDRADTLWARYCESRDRALNAKNIVQRLASI